MATPPETKVERIILKHLIGSKASSEETIELGDHTEITIGRNPLSSIVYDADKDDLVSANHAKLTVGVEDPMAFMLTDLGSCNGTFVNQQRVTSPVRLKPGDVVQFGAGGPEFVFDCDPRPGSSEADKGSLKSTRLAVSASLKNSPAISPTRNSARRDSPSAGAVPAKPSAESSSSSASAAAASTGQAAPASIGRATVERLIAGTRGESRKAVISSSAALVMIIALTSGMLIWKKPWQMDVSDVRVKLAEMETRRKAEEEAAKRNAPVPVDQIVTENTNGLTYIENGWKLIYTPTGQQLFHEYIPNRWPLNVPADQARPIINDGRRLVAVYYVLDRNTIEPSLVTSGGVPIGTEHSGSGFTVSSDGFILTNRHVAASWKTTYSFPRSAEIGVAYTQGEKGWEIHTNKEGRPYLYDAPSNWVPANTKSWGRQKLEGDFEGRNDYLRVTFPKTETRIEAKLVRVSDRHDIALLKIDVPEAVHKCELNDNYDVIKPGDVAIVMGYPGNSPRVYKDVESQDAFNRRTVTKIVPDPSVTPGNIGRILRAQTQGEGRSGDSLWSSMGDAYQLTTPSYSGNSGGPVFDAQGRVIGILYSGGQNLSFAVPIRYGKELMSPTAK
jgi:S1-C subfamily serine protease